MSCTVEVRRVLKSTKLGRVLGCVVLEGEIRRGDVVAVSRGGRPVGRAAVEDVRRYSACDVVVGEGLECGIRLPEHLVVEEGDVLEGTGDRVRLEA